MSAPWWIVILIFAAIFLLILDLIVPSAGALLILSLISAISAIVIAFQYDYYWGMGTLIVLFAVTPWLLFLAVKIWPKTFIGKMMIRARPESPEEVLPDTLRLRELKSMVGELGEAETNFMPSGTVIIQGKRFDANSHVGFISKGTVIEVLAVQLGHLVVAPCSSSRLNILSTEMPHLEPKAHSTSAPMQERVTHETAPHQEDSQPPQHPTKKLLDWSLEDEKLLEQTLDQSLEGIDLSSHDRDKS